MTCKRVTIEDVAQAAGVSRQTVSRATNNSGEISPQTRERVLRLAAEMGYRPSGIARSLATQRTHNLGLVVPDNANPFFSEVARGAEQVAHMAGYNVFLCNSDEDGERELAVLASLEEKRVDGVVLCSPRLDDDKLGALVMRHPTAVLVNRRLDGVAAVLVDDEVGGRMATEHLLQAGHRAVGFLAGPSTSHSGRRRGEGYRAALAAAGLPQDPDWVRPCSPTVEGGQKIARELLAAHSELTALFCYNDLVAVGTLQACADLGRRVPQDLAVVGFDDIPLAALVTPPLTTCRVPLQTLGERAMQLLLDRIENRPSECTEVILRPELVVRASAP